VILFEEKIMNFVKKSLNVCLLSFITTMLVISGYGSVQTTGDAATSFLNKYITDKKLTNVGTFVIKKNQKDRSGWSHVRFQQFLNNVPVWGGEAAVHVKSDDSLFTISNNIVNNLAVDTTPILTSKQAIDKAKLNYSDSAFLTQPPTADIWIYRSSISDYLVYRVQMTRIDGSNDSAMPVYFIDAKTGNVISTFDNLQTSGPSNLYPRYESGSFPVYTYYGSETLGQLNFPINYLQDTDYQKFGVFDFRNATASTYPITKYLRFTSDYQNFRGTEADAFLNAQRTLSYFSLYHFRNGISDNDNTDIIDDWGPATAVGGDGTPLLKLGIHYGSAFNNAAWTGSFMYFGDGDGTRFSPIVSTDVTAHELTHGITQYSAGLAYRSESGALNESMSDVFGAMVERNFRTGDNPNVWKIGEDVYTPAIAGDALRYMDNPMNGLYRVPYSGTPGVRTGYPDHYSIRYMSTGCRPRTTTDEGNDNCGVHINSSIPNHAFYLLAQGGTHRLGGSMTGIGPDKAAEIWYLALTGNYLMSNSNFSLAKQATIDAALQLSTNGSGLFPITSADVDKVRQAWTLVGVN
jgi:Zn-dependent metalloprotease